MTFSSLVFLFGFLPIIWFLYTVLPSKVGKNILLLVASFLFYAWDTPLYLVLLILSILWNYSAAINLSSMEDDSKNKTILFWVSIGVNLFLLGFFKYADFLIDLLNILPLNMQHLNLGLPVGLSFFTFSAISYLVDVYTKKEEAQKDLLSLALYISFFGKVNMGPIVQYADMQAQLVSRHVSSSEIKEGVFLFLKGLFKKVLLADQLAMLYQGLQSNTTVLGTWLFALSYMLQLYFDFSGYSDMAIGLSRLFGFHFEPNFDHPYSARSVQDFWRRWHISLSRWFRDYVYIPLGGNRVSTKKYIRNIFVVWFLTGLWHGANWTFMFWGLYYGCFLLLERFVLKNFLERLPEWVQHLYALLIVLIGWVFFMSPTISQAFHTLTSMVGFGASGFVDANFAFYLKNYAILLIVSIFFCGDTYPLFEQLLYRVFRRRMGVAMAALYFFLFVISISYLVSSTFQSFLYFAF